MRKKYGVIVIGSGHAGCEAALACARMGVKTLLLTLNLDSIAYLACNPSIGGTAKGQLVSEIDALGGQMGIIADKTTLQLRMLNSSKGPAVRSLRAQVDKNRYHIEMKKVLENTKNLDIKQAEVSKILTNDGKVCGICTAQGAKYLCDCAIVCTGVYLKSKVIIGKYHANSGPNGFMPANKLTKSLITLGIPVKRFKTGTPVRIHGDTIDYSKLEVQHGDHVFPFSTMTKRQAKNVKDCYLTYTNLKTHEIILKNLDRSPLFNGTIKSTGPRYCPSIETKVVKFADKDRHQLFLEPEAGNTKEVYLQGLSTSLPIDLQEKMVHSIAGLENAHIMRDGYAIEYDCIDSLSLYPTLESKIVNGLYFAGQVNGTSGYEEAGAQGILAGINAALKLKNREPLILDRSNSYIGVLVDDLVTKGCDEPYRMMTSRAEYRLLLRQDNADQRLTEIGRNVGLVSDARHKLFREKMYTLSSMYEILDQKPDFSELKAFFIKMNESIPQSNMTYRAMLSRSNIGINDICSHFDILNSYPQNYKDIIETEVKYAGYIKIQRDEIEKARKIYDEVIPDDINYNNIKGLRIEAQCKLDAIRPHTLGQASRISGVNPADISVLSVYLKVLKSKKK